MKKVMLIFVVLLCGSCPAITRVLNLKQALDNKYIRCNFKSAGGYQGKCINLLADNLTSDSVRVILNAGTKLDSKTNDEQDILVTENLLVLMGPRGHYTGKVKGYCCQASNRAPHTGGIYVPTHVDTSLSQMAHYLAARDFPAGIEQMAVWIVSNRHPVANLPDSTEALSSLRYLAARLSGQTIPWYNVQTRTWASNSGEMHTMPLFLFGTIKYDNDQTQYVTCSVMNEKGLPVASISSQWLLAGKDLSYPVKVPVAGLDKGKYSIQLRAGETMLAQKSFEM